MKFSPLPIYGGSYADDTLAWSAQDCLGWIPSNAETSGTKTPGMFKTPPGLRPFAETVPGGGARPVRGAWNAEGKFFVVIGTQLYQLSNTGVFIPIGTIPGTGRVIFSHNQVSLGNQILAVNGSAGYIYDTRNGVFQRITDPGYPGAFVSTFIDGYFVQISTNRRFAFNSDVANGLEYNTLDRFTSEFSPDLLVSLVASNNELFLLSETSGEFFENTGASQQPFRSKRITMDRGCAGAYTVAKADNTVFWLGNNGYFYVLNGYAPQRISTRAIEQSILGKNWKQAFAFAWEDAGHTVIYWTFPDGLTWGYDTSTGLWHRRESYGLSRWRVNTMTFWNQEWYAGDFQYGRMWKMDWDYILEGDQEFPSERTTAVIHDNQNRIIIPRLELLMQVGQEETVPVEFPVQPEPPEISGSYPDGTVSVANSAYPYVVTNGTPPYTFSNRAGNDPAPGIPLMGTNGIVPAGTPTATGNYEHRPRVTDFNGLFADLIDPYVVTSNMLLLASRPPPTAGANRCIVRSTSGNIWNAAPTAVGVVPDGVEYILGLPDRILVYGASTLIYTSLDFGATFPTSTNDLAGQASHRSCYDPATDVVFMPAGSVGLYSSADRGATFSLISGVADCDDAYVVGDIGFSLYNGSATFYSTSDSGVTWQSASNPFPGSGASGGRNRFATDGTLLLMSGQRTLSGYSVVYIDQAGVIHDVTPTLVSGTEIYAVGYGNGNWVLASDTGEIHYRPSLTTGSWILATDSLGVSPDSIAFNGAYTVIVGDNGGPSGDAVVKYSTDLDIWTAAPLNIPLDSYVLAVQG